MLSDEVGQTFDKTLGLVAKVTAEEFEKRFRQGDFGPVLSVGDVPQPPEPCASFGNARSAAAAAVDERGAQRGFDRSERAVTDVATRSRLLGLGNV